MQAAGTALIPSLIFRDLNSTLTSGYLSKFGNDLKYISYVLSYRSTYASLTCISRLQHYAQQSCTDEGDAKWNMSYFEDHANGTRA